jgi:hypothetical protein
MFNVKINIFSVKKCLKKKDHHPLRNLKSTDLHLIDLKQIINYLKQLALVEPSLGL